MALFVGYSHLTNTEAVHACQLIILEELEALTFPGGLHKLDSVSARTVCWALGGLYCEK